MPRVKKIQLLSPEERANYLIGAAERDKQRDARRAKNAAQTRARKAREQVEAAMIERVIAAKEPTAPKSTVSAAGKVAGGVVRLPEGKSFIRELTPFEKMTGRRERVVPNKEQAA